MTLLNTDQLVFTKDGKTLTNSKTIAAFFSRRHKDILRAIRNFKCSKSFKQKNFLLSEYADASGNKRPMFNLTKDGFIYLTVGFTGSQAAQKKETLVEQFDLISQKLNLLQRTAQNNENLTIVDPISTSYLVHIHYNKPETSSVLFAAYLGIDHDQVMGDILHMECADAFIQRHFTFNRHKIDGVELPPLYHISYPGFVFLSEEYLHTHKNHIIAYLREFIRVTEQLQMAHALTLTDMQNTLDNIAQEVAA